MSNIVFSFDANAAGALAAFEAISEGIDGLISVTERLASAFASVNSTAETWGTALTTLLGNFNDLTATNDAATSSMGRSSRAASDLAYQLQQLSERSAELARQHQETVTQIEQQEQDLTTTTQEQIARRQESYQHSYDDLVRAHQDAVDAIKDQEQSLSENYLDQMNSRLLKLNDPNALQNKYITDALQQQIDAALATGNTSQLASLEAQLKKQQDKYQTYLNTVIKPYYADLDAIEARHYQEAQDKLNQRLNNENSKYQSQSDYLKQQYDQQLTDIETNYQKREKALEDHLAKEDQQYAYQQQRLSEERQHMLDNAALGGGGAGGGVEIGTPVHGDGSIQLLKMLGIDPEKDPAKAAQALQNWVLGIPFNGVSLGRGAAFNSQLTIPMIQSVIGQQIAFGLDPTRNLRGNENYVDLFSNLAGLARASAPGRSEQDIVNSLMQVMAKSASGNTQGLLRQLTNLGFTKTMLEDSGLKFGGATGNTILNPSDAYNALLNLAHNKAGGLGATEATGTFAGLMNQVKDLWYRTAQEIGDPNNPGGLWKRFVGQIKVLVEFLMSHRQEIVNFGKTVFEWLIAKFKDFNTWLQSPQGHTVLDDIGKGFRAIGDALHWVDQHKEIIGLIMGLLVAQGASKIVGGLSINPLLGLLNGGITGGAGGLASSLLGLAGGGLGHLGGVAGDTRALATLMQGFGSIGGLAGAAGPIAPGIGIFEHIGKAFGVSPAQARLAGLFTHPLESIFTIGSQIPAGVAGTGKTAGLAGYLAMLSGKGMLANAGTGIGNVAATVGSTFTAGGGGASGVFSVLKLLPGLLPSLSGLGPALAGLAAASGPILLVVAAIAGLAFVLFQNRDKILPVLKQLAGFFGEQFGKAAKAVQGFIHDVQSRLGPAFGPGSFVYNLLQFFGKFWSGAWNGIKLAFSGVWDIISGIIKIAWAIISNLILLGLDLLSGKWGKAWKDIQNLLSGVWDGIKQTIGGALKVVSGVLLGFFQGLWALVSTPLTNFWNLLVKFFTGIPDDIGKALSGLGTAISNAFSGLKDLTHIIFKFIIDHAGPLSGPLSGLAHTLAIPGYALGGDYPGGELAMVGERGPELFYSGNNGRVITLQQIRDLLFGGDANGLLAGGRWGRGQIVIAGDVHLHGIHDMDAAYQKITEWGGRRAEYYARGLAGSAQ